MAAYFWTEVCWASTPFLYPGSGRTCELPVSSDVKFHEIFCPEIFHEIFLKYIKNFTFFPALHSPV